MDNNKETTKERLIQAGIKVFAASGFNGASTRMIVEQAGGNLAAIPYYFGGKEGLYLAVFKRIADFPDLFLGSHIKAIRNFLKEEDRSPETALELLKQLLGTMLELNCSHSPTASHMQLITREPLNPSSAFDILYNRVIKREVDLITRLLAVITGEGNRRTTSLQAFILIGQVMIFHHGREVIFRHMDLKGYNTTDIGEICQLIATWIDKTLRPNQTDR
jgi:AcrR family transcriptional regulator